MKRSYRTRILAVVLLGCASAGVDAAAAVAGRVTVTVTNGRVTSEPAGIDCADGSPAPGPVCAANFPDGTTVQLHAVSRIGPESKSTWSGACTHTGGPMSGCAVAVAGDVSASVRFESDPIEARLGHVSVVKGGSGTGVVTSAPGAIVCGDVCHSSFAKPTTVTLTASPSPGSVFTGWAGSCASYGAAPTCVIEVSGGQLAWTVSATFDLAPPPPPPSPPAVQTVVVIPVGSGSGIVTSSPGPIVCGDLCAGIYAVGTAVTLSATPAEGSVFSGWGGSCAGVVTTSCVVHVASGQDAAASATFDLASPPPPPPPAPEQPPAAPPAPGTVSVVRSGSGDGVVTAAPGSIACGPTCTQAFEAGTTVTLTATAAARSVFVSWGGACAGVASASPCVVQIPSGENVTVTAVFDALPAPPAPRAQCRVPRLRGLTLVRARSVIAAAGCRLGRVSRVFSGVRKGRIVAQRPPAGTMRPRGAVVAVVVSRGARR